MLPQLMQDFPLTIAAILRRMEGPAARRKVVSHFATAPTTHLTWKDVARRSRRLMHVLDHMTEPGDVVGCLGWNSHRQVELSYAVPCAGRVFHAVNFRLHEPQIAAMLAHANDRVLFVDASLTGRLTSVLDRLPVAVMVVVMEDGGEIHERFADATRYEQMIATASESPSGPDPDEDAAASLCYTSGTTGEPKGVAYSHRSTFLHALQELGADSYAISRDDCVLPIVPMFHANAHGLPYAAALAGADLVLAGSDVSATHLAEVIERERVTFASAVPTIWTEFEPMYASGGDLRSLRRVICGGAPVSDGLVERYTGRGVDFRVGWGMTEMSPSGTIARAAGESFPVPGVELRIVDGADQEVSWDGESSGEVEVRGPWVARAYLNPDDDANEARFHGGWLRSGDVGTLGLGGALRILDRIKDVVKSGGEWISSQEIERHLVEHPCVREATVIGIPDDRWGERPAAFVVTQPDSELWPEDVRAYLQSRVATWWLPDVVEFVESLPRTGLGKVDKKLLRATYEATYRQLEDPAISHAQVPFEQ